MRDKILKPITFGFFILNLVIIIAAWLNGGALGFKEKTISGPLIAVGDLLGLIAFYLVLWQMLLIGRVSWIEKAWGHDRLSRVHHKMGVVTVVIILFHPILMIVGYSQEAQTTLVGQFIIFLTQYRYVLNAFIAYLMFLVIVSMSLWLVKKRLRYELWYFIHFTLYGAILLVFNHQIANGRDFSRDWVIWYWKFLFYGAFALIIYNRFIKPLWNLYYYDFKVEKLETETSNVTSIIINSKHIERFKAVAGQFIIVRFLVRGFWWEAHPFSLSEMPNGKRLRITVKAVGDFTTKLPTLPVGTKVFIEGPLGLFTTDRAGNYGKILLIAGGIGITPLKSLFEKFANIGSEVSLLYSARSENDFALKSELDKLINPNARVYYFAENKLGRLTPELIKNSVPDINQRFVYLCGPPPMMKAVRRYLLDLGLSKKNIIYEKFKLG